MNYNGRLDYQERIDFIKCLAITNGATVLDASAVINLGFSNHLRGRDGYQHAKKTVEAERKFIQGLALLFSSNDSYVCPLETREEFDLFTPNYFFLGNQDPRLRELLAGLVRDRHSMVAKMRKVSNRMPAEITPCLDTIRRIVLKSSLEFYAEHAQLRKARAAKKSLAEHNGDDEAILAKCIALSYGERVRLVSQDGDFIHLHRAVYDGLNELTTNGLALPQHPVELAFIDRKWNVKFIPPIRRARRLAHMS